MNKERIIKIISIVIIVFILSIATSYISYLKLEKIVLDNNAKVINEIHENYPDLEEEVIEIILNSNNIDEELIDKYNINTRDSLSNIKSVSKLRKEYLIKNIIIFLLVLVIVVLILFYYYKKQMKEIDKLSRLINEAIKDNYDFIILESNETKLKRVENDLYKLIKKIKNQNEKLLEDKIILKDYISDISHQLKTPLTAININNDILSKEKLSKKDKEKFLNNSSVQVEKMKVLIYNLLKLSKLDANVIELKKEKIVLNKLLKEVVKEVEALTKTTKQSVIIKGNKDITVFADYIWLKEAITNIVKNALEHSDKKQIVKVTFKDNPIYTEIKIIDNGEGIAKAELSHIFERFYKTRNSNKDSIGIGLAISKEIIEKLDGEILVTSDKETIFEIKLYKVM